MYLLGEQKDSQVRWGILVLDSGEQSPKSREFGTSQKSNSDFQITMFNNDWKDIIMIFEILIYN